MDNEQHHELRDRVAKVEQRVEDWVVQGNTRVRQMERIEEKLDVLEKDLSRYRGLVGGVLVVVTSVIGFFKLFYEDIVNYFGK
jgi:hypothetical protein